jgi:hypothetical protein
MKWGDLFRYGLVAYATSTFLYNVFGIYLPYARHNHYMVRNLSTHDTRSYIFYSQESNYIQNCSNESALTVPVDLLIIQLAIFLKADEGSLPPDILPYLTIFFFWSGQVIMLLVSVIDFFIPCDGSKRESNRKLDRFELWSTSTLRLQEDMIESTTLPEKVCRFLCRFMMGLA